MNNPLKQETNDVIGMATTPAPVDMGLGPDEAAAALAFATHIAEGMMPPPDSAIQGQPEAPQSAQEAPGQELEPQGKEEPETGKMDELEAKIDQKLEILREELKGNQKVEIDSLKKLISDALENEQN